jgi:hypothetical protein
LSKPMPPLTGLHGFVGDVLHRFRASGAFLPAQVVFNSAGFRLPCFL